VKREGVKMPGLSVSVIIDTYNYVEWLEEAIQSALSQDYRAREIIVVDDGSTDGSRELIERYQRDGRVRAVFKPNGGQASAFNAGFAVSSGDLICLLDSDDLWLPNKLTRVVKAAERHRSAGIICHPVQPVDARGRHKGKPKPGGMPNGSIKKRVLSSGGYWRWPPTSGLSFRRALLEQILPMPEPQFRTCADAYLATISPLLAEVASIAEPSALYRIHGGNLWAPTNSEPRAPDGDAMKESSRLEVLSEQVNRKLAALGKIDRLSLENHLPYRMLQRMRGAGVGQSLLSLLICALTWPGDEAPVRLKMFAKNLPPLIWARQALTA
jgi:hypothetical protein